MYYNLDSFMNLNFQDFLPIMSNTTILNFDNENFTVANVRFHEQLLNIY